MYHIFLLQLKDQYTEPRLQVQEIILPSLHLNLSLLNPSLQDSLPEQLFQLGNDKQRL